MEDALAVEVVKAAGNVQRQTDSHTPRQVEVTVQQLLQVSSIYILEMGRGADVRTKTRQKLIFLIFELITAIFNTSFFKGTSVRACS